MAKYRHDLPQRHGGIFLTDGGMETTLIFHEGIELPHFAAFVLLDSPEGRQHLKRYYASYLAVARDHGTGFVLDSPTWRANPDWGAKLGFFRHDLSKINRDAVTEAKVNAALDEVIARCKEETGLEPPKPAVPLRWSPLEDGAEVLARVREREGV